MHLGWRDIEALRDVIHRALADPADAFLNGVQGGKQQVAARARFVSSKRDTPIPIGLKRSPPSQNDVGSPSSRSTAALSSVVAGSPVRWISN